ncbi:hypothetical protein VQ03_00280 [Methylobacterium tarhaniae]|uniref:Uncharacterized protein n=1 Tax=Methylobacterium tarhaniae TaxID=1187852 RepID=A0A0J6TCC7_9HYPH|nr:DUF4150 domain-containing protein [Methylobacterium tarhaniae]KMO44960.1 hypothetical protein VQ03_00280 [Methylobacterium tarhaniae]
MGYADDTLPGDDLASPDYRRAYFAKNHRKDENWAPPPTAAKPAPPELIPATDEAITVCTSPDMCRSPTAPVPDQVWGKADDQHNYSPDVRSNGLAIKRQDSAFTRTYGDEPGTGKGVKSNTVGGRVEPVTSSRIVQANGIPVQRHGDACALNRGHCPGEYVRVKSTPTHEPPDGRDEMSKPWYRRFWDQARGKSTRGGTASGAWPRSGTRTATTPRSGATPRACSCGSTARTASRCCSRATHAACAKP